VWFKLRLIHYAVCLGECESRRTVNECQPIAPKSTFETSSTDFTVAAKYKNQTACAF